MFDTITWAIAKRIIRLVDSVSVRLRRLDQKTMKRRGIEEARRLANTIEDVKLDLGCGSLKRRGYVGLDLSPTADIQWDMRWGLPFEDASVSEIRSDHFFEHLELAALVEVLRECRRVLVPGGVLDFTVPHLDPYLAAYLRRDLRFLKERIYDVPEEQELVYGTCFDRVAWLLHRSGEHRSFFDEESIVAKAKLSGFEDVTTREFDPGKDGNLRFSSVYVVATKSAHGTGELRGWDHGSVRRSHLDTDG